MFILLPKPTHENYGLFFNCRDRWVVVWKENGKQKTKTLPKDTPVEQARAVRDHLFAKLRSRGAVIAGSKSAARRSNRYIYHRSPYYVRVAGVHVGDFETYAEAEKARNEYLEKNA